MPSAQDQMSEDQMAEKLLECIFITSKHFSEGALIEYNAAAGTRQFEYVVGGVAVRHFTAVEQQYHPLCERSRG